MLAKKISLKRLYGDEDGAVTVDWVALTSATLLLGTAIVWAVFTDGVGPLVREISLSLSKQSLLDPISMNNNAEPGAGGIDYSGVLNDINSN